PRQRRRAGVPWAERRAPLRPVPGVRFTRALGTASSRRAIVRSTHLAREGRMTVTIGLSWGPFCKSFQGLGRAKCQTSFFLDTFGRALITVAIAERASRAWSAALV